MAPGLLYFPGHMWPGFLLRALPVQTTVLPEPLADHYSLHRPYAGRVSPDGAAFALVDSIAPSVVMVVDADGGRREAIAPAPDLPGPKPRRASQSLRTRMGLGAHGARLAQERLPASGRCGQWLPPRRRRNVVEQLFIDEQLRLQPMLCRQQRQLPAGAGAAARAAELRKTIRTGLCAAVCLCAANGTWAFGATVSLLLLSAQGGGGTGAAYSAYLDGAQDAVVAQLSARLERRQIPFVRADQCPRRTDYRDKCEAQLAEKLQRPESLGRELEQLINSMEGQPGVLFILPSMAVVVRARPEGGSMIQTLLRADFSRKD